jgi:hypothetical protein
MTRRMAAAAAAAAEAAQTGRDSPAAAGGVRRGVADEESTSEDEEEEELIMLQVLQPAHEAIAFHTDSNCRPGDALGQVEAGGACAHFCRAVRALLETGGWGWKGSSKCWSALL